MLIGGEPFVRQDIHLIVKAFTSRGSFRLQTNGLATEEQLENCLKAMISISQLNQKTQDKINGGFKNKESIKNYFKVSKI